MENKMKTNDLANWLLEESFIEAKQYITEAKKKITKEEVFEDAVQTCFKRIQTLVGQKHGDLASHYYDEEKFEKLLMPYIEAEMKEAGMLTESKEEIGLAEAVEKLDAAYNHIKKAINYLERESDRTKFKKLVKELEVLNNKFDKAVFGPGPGALEESTKEFQDPTRKEMEKFLEGKKKALEAEDFDVQVAIHYYASEYHSGQSSNLYSALSTSKYKPGRSESGAEDVSDQAGMLYNELQDKFGR
jgi:hypothetical protein